LATSIDRLEWQRFGAPDTQDSLPWRSPRAIHGAWRSGAPNRRHPLQEIEATNFVKGGHRDGDFCEKDNRGQRRRWAYRFTRRGQHARYAVDAPTTRRRWRWVVAGPWGARDGADGATRDGSSASCRNPPPPSPRSEAHFHWTSSVAH